jgi:hypothetical protein
MTGDLFSSVTVNTCWLLPIVPSTDDSTMMGPVTALAGTTAVTDVVETAEVVAEISQEK